MLKQEFMTHIYDTIESNSSVFLNDKPAIRMLFSTMLDDYNKEGMITDSQAYNWILTARELNKCLSIAKG